MTKNNLKTGMIVTNREGTIFTVLLDYLGKEDRLSGQSKTDLLCYYNDDLTHHSFKDLDIMKVTRPTIGYITHNSQVDIWSRDEAVEMTMKQICEALGKSVKIIK